MVLGFSEDGGGAGDRRDGVDQVGGIEGFAADFAAVAVLVGRFAVGAGAFDEAVGEEDVGHGIVELFDFAEGRDAGGLDAFVDARTERSRLRSECGGAKVVEGDAEVGEVVFVLCVVFGDEGFGRDALLRGR